MKTTEIISEGKIEPKIFSLISKRLFAVNVLYFLLGLFISKGTVFGKYSPFGAALIAAVPYENLWVSLLGTVIGYLIPSSVNIGVRYIATAIAICAIRWTLNDLKKIKIHPLYAPALAALPLLATGFVVNRTSSFFNNLISINMIEAALAGTCAYFFKETVFITSGRKHSLTISQQELASISMTVFVIILSLSSVTVGPVSIGKVLAMVVVLFCAQYLGVVGGSVSGIAAGVVFGLASKEPSYLSSAYSFGGMIAGIVSGFGKYVLAGAFMASNLILSAQTSSHLTIISGVYEVVIATVIFIFLPDSLGEKLMGLFYYPKKAEVSENLQQSLLKRLNFVASALFSVGDSINTVSKKLSKLGGGELEKIYSFVTENVCNKCGLKTLCWETRRDETIGSFDAVSSILENDSQISQENFPKVLANRCCRLGEISEFVNRFYRENSIRKASQKRINAVKSFVTEQFSDMGCILKNISKEFELYDTFDLKIAQEVSCILKELGLIPVDVTCRLDKFRRLYLEIEILHKSKEEIESLNLAKRLSRECSRVLDNPSITVTPEKCKIKINEKALFTVKIGAAQHTCKNETLCGDSYTYFSDGLGRMIFMLSDGMGTGGRAAVEGAMACEIMSTLIKSGISFETALKITNSALLVKSEDESLATLDIVSFDLFTGKTEFVKAGAPLSFVKTSANVKKIDLPSLPVGILSNINFVHKKEMLSKNDKILLLSDGVIYPDEIWVEKEIERWSNQDSQTFAEQIVEKATSLRQNSHDDDITAIAIQLDEY